METLIALMIATGLLGRVMSQLADRSNASGRLVPIRLRAAPKARRRDPTTRDLHD